MKKIFLLSIVTMSVTLVHAQLSKGTIQLGGGFSYYSIGEKTEGLPSLKTSYFSIQPNVGYFVADRNVVGLILMFENNKDEGRSFNAGTGQVLEHTISSSILSFGAYHRAFFSVNDYVAFFVQTKFMYGVGSRDLEYDLPMFEDETEDVTSIDINLTPGIAVFVSPKIGIDVSVGLFGYESVTTENSDIDYKATENSVSARFNLSTLALGLQYYPSR